MGSARPFNDRDEREVAVIEALINRQHDGLTVFELRSLADIDIDELEKALQSLQADGLIRVERNGERTVIYPDESVIPDPDETLDQSVLGAVIDRLPWWGKG